MCGRADPHARRRGEQMSVRRRAVSAVAGLSMASMLLTGCGLFGSEPAAEEKPAVSAADLPPNGVEKLKVAEILSRARAAAKKAGTVRVQRTSGTGGTRSVLDARVGSDAGIATLTGGGSAFEVRRVGGSLYYHGDEATAARSIGQEAAKLLGGRWFVVPENDGNVAIFTDTLTFSKVVKEALKGTGVTKGKVVTYLEQPAIKLSDKRRNLYIALRGEPLLLAVENRTSRVKTVFSEWGEPVRVNPPPGEPIKVNELVTDKPKATAKPRTTTKPKAS